MPPALPKRAGSEEFGTSGLPARTVRVRRQDQPLHQVTDP